MPTFQDPLADAAEASEALRGLAHASRVFDDPADTYTVFGDLTAGLRSLRQVLDQLANAHLAHRERAFDDDGNPVAGAAEALAAADGLHQAGTLLDQAHDRLDAAFTHSGRIAWHPQPTPEQTAVREPIAARLDGDPATTAQAGTLRLAVWPDAPVGEHHRYGYRITDVTTGQELEGRDLFTGAGTPVEPDRALRDLATFLGAAGEAHQYALDHPGSAPDHAGMFPAWVAETAHTNTDALAELSEHSPSEPVAGLRWLSVVFLQGAEADQVLDVIDRDGTDAAIEHLAQWDYGQETTEAALENGYVYDEPPTGALDRVVTAADYTLTYDHAHGHVALLRAYDVPPDPALDDAKVMSAREAISGVGSHEHSIARGRRGPTARAPQAPQREVDWFAGPTRSSSSAGRGLSL
ncbi:hypothetical protein [Brevibacterium casei]|uniref:Uncharacterized protein n=1 Tax=Brevibacterium casei CIP 102111 TaxID=1255625 RepID=A0A2H1K2B6_9MICO|nr:hypothetical protein BC102111_02820 [Brevibacterium casei CIP 102111]